MNIPELLIPAGDLERLRTAIRFGADAVYVGGAEYSLRAIDTGFTLEELEIGIRFAHERGAKVYLALNIIAYDEDLKEMLDYLRQAIDQGIDAVIVADPGFIQEIHNAGLGVKIHLSTQANTTNASAVQFWANQGVERIVLARELNLLQISEIRKAVEGVELEAFIHGAMCMAYSGRCLISKHFTGRHANRGECAHPCRWKYFLTEEEDKGRVLEIEGNERGTYIMNSRDLCMIGHIPELLSAGLSSLKIEGRMKSPYYVAIVTKMYRQAIDLYCTNPDNYIFDEKWLRELENISHRPYSTGFYFGDEQAHEMQHEASAGYIKNFDFVGVVQEYDQKERTMLVQARNRIRVGAELGIIDPHRGEIISFKVDKILALSGEALPAAHNQYTVRIPCPHEVSAFSLLRAPRELVTTHSSQNEGQG